MDYIIFIKVFSGILRSYVAETRKRSKTVPEKVPTGIFKISYGFPLLRNILSFSPLRAST